MKLLLVLALIGFLASGCITPASPPSTVTIRPGVAQRVVELFARHAETVMEEGYFQTGLTPPDNEPGLVDAAYVCPTPELLDSMDSYVRPLLHTDYVAEAWDCDDIAKEWCILTHRWWVDTTKGRVPVALATFIAYVEIEAGAFDGRFHMTGGHALGLLCDSQGVWWFVEPVKGWHVKAQEALFEGNIVTDQIVW